MAICSETLAEGACLFRVLRPHRAAVPPKLLMLFLACLSPTCRLLAVNSDREGRTYVSAVEAFDWPIYGVQWHPEKVTHHLTAARSPVAPSSSKLP